MGKYLLLLIIVIVGTAGQILLKLTNNQLIQQLPEINSFKSLAQTVFIFLKSYKILFVVLLYVAGFFLWFFALTKFELSYALPLITATVLGLVLLFAWIFLKEDMTALRIVGTLTIAIGIILVAKS